MGSLLRSRYFGLGLDGHNVQITYSLVFLAYKRGDFSLLFDFDCSKLLSVLLVSLRCFDSELEIFLFACSSLLATHTFSFSPSFLLFSSAFGRASLLVPASRKIFLFSACDSPLLHLFLIFLAVVSRKWGVNHMPRICLTKAISERQFFRYSLMLV